MTERAGKFPGRAQIPERNKTFYVAAYIRLSREDGDRQESDSVGNQRQLLMDFIDSRKDLSLYEFYVDDGFTGTNFERPAFQKMLRDIRHGQVNCVAVKDLSRFGRDYIDTGRYLERCFPEMGVRFIAVSDGIDSQKHAYDILLPIKNIFNEQYARDISGKIHATMTAKQRAGEFIGSFPSYGYRKSPADKNKLIIDEYPAAVVRRIFSLYLQGYGKQKIASLLNKEGVLCPAAYKQAMGMNYRNPNCLPGNTCWSYSTVNTILHREMYVGNMVQGTKYQRMRGHQKARNREQWIVVEHTHEPIIDRDTWERTQSLLKHRAENTSCSPRTHSNPFAGLVRCGDCGRTMVKNTWRRADGSTACSLYCGTYRRNGSRYCSPHTIPLHALSEIVAEDLRNFLLNAEKLTGQTLAGHIREQLTSPAGTRSGRSGSPVSIPGPALPSADTSDVSSRKNRFRTELDRLRARKKSLYEDYQDGLITREEYLSYREDYRQKELLLSGQLEQLEKRNVPPEKQLFSEPPAPEQLLKRITPETLSRKLIAEFISEIKIYEDHRLEITYNFTPGPEATARSRSAGGTVATVPSSGL